MRSGLDGILLSGQPEGIITHWVQHIESFQALVSCKNVRSNIAQRMTYMQTRSGGVGEHVQNVKFWFAAVVGNFIGSICSPVLLPFFFNVLRSVFHILLMLPDLLSANI